MAKNQVIRLENIPDNVYDYIMEKKTEMIKEKKRHVSNEKVVFTIIKNQIDAEKS